MTKDDAEFLEEMADRWRRLSFLTKGRHDEQDHRDGDRLLGIAKRLKSRRQKQAATAGD